jgi:hypothetical protein
LRRRERSTASSCACPTGACADAESAPRRSSSWCTLVADVHQPLAPRRRGALRGGLDFQVEWRGKGRNLHLLWDLSVLDRALEASSLDEAGYLRYLQAQPALPRTRRGAPTGRRWTGRRRAAACSRAMPWHRPGTSSATPGSMPSAPAWTGNCASLAPASPAC